MCIRDRLADADAGEPVPYRVVGSLPSNWDSFRTYRYEFHDEFSDEMAVDLASVKVVIKDGDKGSLDVTQAFDVKLDGRELSVSTSDLKAASPDVSKDAKVFLTYSASINPDGFATGPSKPKKNFAHIVYTAKPDVQRAADGATAKTKEDGATVYTWALAINKIAQDGNAPLEGAVFTLEDRDGKYVAANGSRSDKPIELTSDSDGVVYVAGLDAGAYVLRDVYKRQDDDGRGHARDGLRARGGRPRGVHGRWRDRGGGPCRAGDRRSPRGAHARLPGPCGGVMGRGRAALATACTGGPSASACFDRMGPVGSLARCGGE